MNPQKGLVLDANILMRAVLGHLCVLNIQSGR